MIKYSRQRESIVNFLASRTDHPTAETIYQNIKKEFPNISLGTVYRNLSLLEEIGEIIKISTGVGLTITITTQRLIITLYAEAADA